ncbi:hypothetical protein CEXT_161611 [Caerostris extrusa]|uniref:Uncharacterized protein n=1 Tax=Caerostris extrusa TaxID=172846 RepID=A0AAV4MQM8_CAEEX|nr:hypothetical protein CEXT_161611 [Caerostris extrusa]
MNEGKIGSLPARISEASPPTSIRNVPHLRTAENSLVSIQKQKIRNNHERMLSQSKRGMVEWRDVPQIWYISELMWGAMLHEMRAGSETIPFPSFVPNLSAKSPSIFNSGIHQAVPLTENYFGQ